MKSVAIFMVLFSIILFGCKSSVQTKVYETHNPTAMEVLRQNPAADIFQWDGVIYKTNIDWVDNEKVTKKDLLGRITSVYVHGKKFKDGMSTKLPQGSKIYTTNERGGILIVEVGGQVKKYLALVEG